MGSGCFGSKRSKKIMERNNKKTESSKKKKPVVEKKERKKMKNSVKSITNYLNRRKISLKMLNKAVNKYSNLKSEATAVKLAEKQPESQADIAAIIEATGAEVNPILANTGAVNPTIPVVAAVQASTDAAAQNPTANNESSAEGMLASLYSNFKKKDYDISNLTPEGRVNAVRLAYELSKKINKSEELGGIMEELIKIRREKREKKAAKKMETE